MADVVRMPKLGFDMAEGTLVRWVVLENQPITKGAVLAEIETDKATVEVESSHEGTVVKHLVKEGTIVPVNSPIAVVGAAGEAVDYAALGLAEGEPAEAVKPASAEMPVTTAPTVEKETPILDSDLPGGVRATPLARRLASEKRIDLRQVSGSGPLGRILKADIESYTPASPAAPISAPAAASQPAKVEIAPVLPLAPVHVEARAAQQVPMTRLRQAIGRRMTEAKQVVPHFYITREYDMAPVMNLRKQINSLQPDDQKLSVNDFVLKATALTLRLFPNLNASVDVQKNLILQHGQINIGVAVAVENGLLTIVCRDADVKSVRQIGQEVKTLAGRARDGKVRPEDIEGSTFSISNLGMYGVDEFLAIINPPEAAILAVGAAKEVPVVQGGEVKPGWRMKATISVDHRVSDGAEAARFMQAMAQFLEEPMRLLI